MVDQEGCGFFRRSSTRLLHAICVTLQVTRPGTTAETDQIRFPLSPVGPTRRLPSVMSTIVPQLRRLRQKRWRMEKETGMPRLQTLPHLQRLAFLSPQNQARVAAYLRHLQARP
jgi:hypothetical protein